MSFCNDKRAIMKQTLFIVLLVVFSNSFGQKEIEDDDYLFDTYNLFEVTLVNELLQATHKFDSIQLVGLNYTITIDSNSTLFQYPASFSIKLNRKKQRIEVIKNENFKAEFTYNPQGWITKIKLNYSKKIRHALYEGTTDCYEFNYENGRLVACNEYGIYGDASPVKYAINYY